MKKNMIDLSNSLLYDGSEGGGQKIWFAVLIGFIFFILASGVPYNLFVKSKVVGYVQLIVETIIFTLILIFILN